MKDNLIRWKLRVECERKGTAHDFAVSSIKVQKQSDAPKATPATR